MGLKLVYSRARSKASRTAEQSLVLLSPQTSLTELREMIEAAVEERHPLCRFYGPLAQNIAAAPDCDPEIVCALYERLQIGHKTEKYLPGRAWLLHELNTKFLNSLHMFEAAHTLRLFAITFVSSNQFFLSLAKLYSRDNREYDLDSTSQVLTAVKRAREEHARAYSSILLTAVQVVNRRGSHPDCELNAPMENRFACSVSRFLKGYVVLTPEEKILRKAMTARLHLLSPNRNVLPLCDKRKEAIVSNETVCEVLANLGSSSSSDPGLRELLRALMDGRERDEIEAILVGVNPPTSAPPPPPPRDHGRNVLQQTVPPGHSYRLTGVNILRAVAGLSGMSDEHPEVRTTISFLCYELCMLLERGDEFKAPDTLLLGALSGMRNFTSNNVAARRLLASMQYCTIIPSPPGRGVNMVKKISNALSGLRKMGGDQKEVIALLKAVVHMLSKIAEDTAGKGDILVVDEKDMRFLFASLRSFCYDDSPVDKYLESINILLTRQKDLKLSAQSAAISMHALRFCDSEHHHVRALLTPLAIALEKCDEVMSTQQVSMCLSGMQNFSTVYPEVLRIVSSLVRFVNTSTGLLSPLGVATCLSGFRLMSHQHNEVRMLISSIVQKIDSSPEFSFQSQELSMALSGLQTMSGDCVEVRDLLDALYPGAVNCMPPLTAQGIAMCVQGFRLCRSEHLAVRRMVGVVQSLIRKSPGVILTEQGVVMCMKNIRYLSSDHEEVRLLITSLLPKISQSREALDPFDFLNCMRGLKAMNSEWAEVRELLDVLRNKIPPTQGEMWWQEILRSDVYGTDDLIADLEYCSQLNPNFSDMMQYVLRDDNGIFQRIVSQRMKEKMSIELGKTK